MKPRAGLLVLEPRGGAERGPSWLSMFVANCVCGQVDIKKESSGATFHLAGRANETFGGVKLLIQSFFLHSGRIVFHWRDIPNKLLPPPSPRIHIK